MIEVQGLTKHFGSTVAVQDLTFTVRPGQVTGFLGPNGAGKSTTMRMILGLDRPTSGSAHINGVPYARLTDPLRVVGALLDAKWVHPNRSAKAHLRWMAATNGIAPQRVDQVLELVGLTSVANKRAGTFSLGMSQRLGLAGALLGDPPVLLFDEPVNGLDPEGILWIRQFMHRLAAEGRTVLVSSHLLSEMAVTAQHLVVIGQGKLIADAPVQEFITRASETRVRVRGPQLEELRALLVDAGWKVSDDTSNGDAPALVVGGATSEQIGQLAADRGVVLYELSPQRASLEEAFMAMTGNTVQYQGGGIAPMGYNPPPPPGYQPAFPQGGPAPQAAGYAPPGYAPAPGSVPPGYAPAPGSVPPGYAPAPAPVPPASNGSVDNVPGTSGPQEGAH